MARKKRGRKALRHVPEAAATVARPKKVPRQAAPADFHASHPTWSFAILDLMAPVGGWNRLRAEDLDEVLARFRNWETMTWRQILVEARKQNHHIDVAKCSKAAQDRLRRLRLDDLEQLVSLTVNARARVIGILDRATFKILWWDPDHNVCPSHLKHT